MKSQPHATPTRSAAPLHPNAAPRAVAARSRRSRAALAALVGLVGARRAAAVVALLVGAVALLPGCDVRTDDRDIRWISVTEAQTLTQPKGFSLSPRKSLAYVDPRSEAAYANGHIPGAVLVPFGDLRSGAAAPLSEFDVLVVYDTDYDDVVARALSKRLIEEGRWDVYTLSGGLKAWEKAGHEVAYGMPDREKDGEDDAVAAEAVGKPEYGRARKR